MRRHGFILIVTLFILFCARRSPRELEHDRKASRKAWWAERHRSLSSQFAIRNRKQYDAALVIYNRVQKCGSRSLLQAIRPTLEDNGVQFGAENLGRDLQKNRWSLLVVVDFRKKSRLSILAYSRRRSSSSEKDNKLFSKKQQEFLGAAHSFSSL